MYSTSASASKGEVALTQSAPVSFSIDHELNGQVFDLMKSMELASAGALGELAAALAIISKAARYGTPRYSLALNIGTAASALVSMDRTEVEVSS